MILLVLVTFDYIYLSSIRCDEPDMADLVITESNKDAVLAGFIQNWPENISIRPFQYV